MGLTIHALAQVFRIHSGRQSWSRALCGNSWRTLPALKIRPVLESRRLALRIVQVLRLALLSSRHTDRAACTCLTVVLSLFSQREHPSEIHCVPFWPGHEFCKTVQDSCRARSPRPTQDPKQIVLPLQHAIWCSAQHASLPRLSRASWVTPGPKCQGN